jgi:Pretoxin HINT domain
MRLPLRFAAVAVLLCAAPAYGVEPAPVASAAHSSANPHEGGAALLVRQALAAEAAGQPERRADYLRQAVAAEPDNATARWQSGEVRQGNRWLPVDQAVRTMNDNLDEYRQRQGNAHDTTYDHFKLANYCASAGLKKQEREELQNVLRLTPRSPEAARRLGLVAENGRLIPIAQAEAGKRERAAHARAALDVDAWRPRLAPLCKDIDGADSERRDAARQRLHAVSDVAALPALESLVKEGGPDAGQAIVSTVAAMPEQRATDSLVMHAVFAPHESVRQAATEALKQRPMYGYVPTLVSALEPPIDVHYDSFSLGDGRSAHHLSLFQPGHNTNMAIESRGAKFRMVDKWVGGPTFVKNVRDPTAAADARMATDADQHNRQSSAINDRVVKVLQSTVGENFGSDTELWWDWWDRYNELYRPAEKPTSFATQSVGMSPIITRYHQRIRTHYRGPHSCFVAGTQVHTPTGVEAIEKIQAGDFVLSQNVTTGELAYKMVVAPTNRPPTPLVEISAGGETIRASRGHPFWVSGLGWQMAKEIRAGEWLHSVGGPVLVDRVEEQGEAECFNLIVADFDTYFVGGNQLLVHDNMLRDGTSATIPGLIEQ